MKNIVFVNGTMGAGKSTVSKQLNSILDNCVYLDGDWCWQADPFVVTEETKTMVIDNICHLLNNFIHCSRYENIVFCWVMDYESIYESIVSKLDSNNCKIWRFTICCSEETLRQRIANDTQQQGRTLERSMERMERFSLMNTTKIYNDNMSPLQTALHIKKIILN